MQDIYVDLDSDLLSTNTYLGSFHKQKQQSPSRHAYTSLIYQSLRSNIHLTNSPSKLQTIASNIENSIYNTSLSYHTQIQQIIATLDSLNHYQNISKQLARKNFQIQDIISLSNINLDQLELMSKSKKSTKQIKSQIKMIQTISTDFQIKTIGQIKFQLEFDQINPHLIIQQDRDTLSLFPYNVFHDLIIYPNNTSPLEQSLLYFQSKLKQSFFLHITGFLYGRTCDDYDKVNQIAQTLKDQSSCITINFYEELIGITFLPKIKTVMSIVQFVDEFQMAFIMHIKNEESLKYYKNYHKLESLSSQLIDL